MFHFSHLDCYNMLQMIIWATSYSKSSFRVGTFSFRYKFRGCEYKDSGDLICLDF